FWLYPRKPRTPARQLFDAVSLAVSVCAFVLAVHWAHMNAGHGHGAMWPQILATSMGYGVFLAVLALAFVLRWRWLRGVKDYRE
ncbi:hypothetical protein AB4084_00880, partial [Lysobacter sp. 2RAB21]